MQSISIYMHIYIYIYKYNYIYLSIYLSICNYIYMNIQLYIYTLNYYHGIRSLKPNKGGLMGPNSIKEVYMDPLGLRVYIGLWGF